MQENSSLNEQHPLINNVLPLSHSITGRRIAKSNIHINISREYSVTSFIHINQNNNQIIRLSSTDVPFELRQCTNLIKPQIRERIETLKQAVYRTQSIFRR
ncbi:unnamed protein product [Rotaria sordida]|uniref:Uncharacterized protein n=1 Tax=Rotaria sordida TaxID=392033 RepID=A0A818H9N2_9BILA|nr:unnamed protein product [Rotaria sordida]CAF3595135.1 unnamed protein product [Rotaria sordida]